MKPAQRPHRAAGLAHAKRAARRGSRAYRHAVEPSWTMNCPAASGGAAARPAARLAGAPADAVAARYSAGAAAQGGGRLSVPRRREIARRDERRWPSQVMRVIEDERFAELFGPGSRAEVPIVGGCRRPANGCVSGQVDRLAVTPSSVLIADFKTNRPPPRSLAEVPPTLYPPARALPRRAVTALSRQAHPRRPDLDRNH